MPFIWDARRRHGLIRTHQQRIDPSVPMISNSATFGAYGEASEKINFLNYYFPGAPDNAVNTEMISLLEEDGCTPDLFSPDGFNAGGAGCSAVERSSVTLVAWVDLLGRMVWDQVPSRGP